MYQQDKHDKDPIQILATLDQNYLPRLKVLLTSIRINQPEETLDIWLLHSRIPEDALRLVNRQCDLLGFRFHPVLIDGSVFEDAPSSEQYPHEMYYRLLAAQFLPESLRRILYLDPDILVINPLRPLWELDLAGNLFAAASHTGKTEFANNINQLRLGTNCNYLNSGVLLIDLDRARSEVHARDIFKYTMEHGKELFLPDQDILNALYGHRTLEIEDAAWNYDARNYNNYLLRSGGIYDMDHVMKHTAILHFCGKSKPWQKGYIHRFGILYKHYMALTDRLLADIC
ncbi:glycosyltransferase family 8 protein [Clostridium sp. Marseille-P3244]|uniref:glycosyltransferase family 8 protein n=1 Tax=Clostridium sp. Marseille-P3244 TaxID=1871020 RepID=UPI0009307DFC|nr:glycosyltransferase family 8 protein [Clostridium sp. Marseille-P3244]